MGNCSYYFFYAHKSILLGSKVFLSTSVTKIPNIKYSFARTVKPSHWYEIHFIATARVRNCYLMDFWVERLLEYFTIGRVTSITGGYLNFWARTILCNWSGPARLPISMHPSNYWIVVIHLAGIVQPCHRQTFQSCNWTICKSVRIASLCNFCPKSVRLKLLVASIILLNLRLLLGLLIVVRLLQYFLVGSREILILLFQIWVSLVICEITKNFNHAISHFFSYLGIN